MYKINERLYAIEKEDSIMFIRDGGGKLDILIGEQGALKSEDGPHTIEQEEAVILTIIPVISI